MSCDNGEGDCPASVDADFEPTFAWSAPGFLQCPDVCGPRPDMVRPVACYGRVGDVSNVVASSFCLDTGPKPSSTQECPAQEVGSSCDDGSDATMNDRCTAEGTCVGKVALTSKVTFNIPAEDLSIPAEDLDASPLAMSIKEGLQPVLSAAGMDCSVDDIQILGLAAGSLVIDYRVNVAVSPGSTTVSDGVKNGAVASMGNVALTIPAEATISGNAPAPILAGTMTVESDPFQSFAYARTRECSPGSDASGEACTVSCGANAIVEGDTYACIVDGLVASPGDCELALGPAPVTETVCCAATSICPGALDSTADEDLLDEDLLGLDPVLLTALAAVVCCILGVGLATVCLYCFCFAHDDHEDDSCDDSHDEEDMAWKGAGTPTASVDHGYPQQHADEGVPPAVPQVDATALEKAMRLKSLLEQVNAGSNMGEAGYSEQDEQAAQLVQARNALRQHNAGVAAAATEAGEEDELGEVDGDHMHAVADRAENAWGKLRASPASAVAWGMASGNDTQPAETSKAALVASWMQHSADTPPPRDPAPRAAAPSVVEATFGPGPLGIKFGKQRVKSGGAEPEWQAVCVAQTFPGQQASQIEGLRQGMAILKVNGKDVKGLPTREVMRALTHSEPPRPLDVTFGWPGNQRRP